MGPVKKIFRNFLLKVNKKLDLRLCVINHRYSSKKYYSNPDVKDGFDKNCPFCKKDNLIKENKFTYIIKNINPYFGTKKHILVVPQRHIRTWDELNEDELKEFQSIISEYLDKWYNLLWRQYLGFGHKNGGSVKHLHIHLIING